MPGGKIRREGMPYGNPRNQSFPIEISKIFTERIDLRSKSDDVLSFAISRADNRIVAEDDGVRQEVLFATESEKSTLREIFTFSVAPTSRS